MLAQNSARHGVLRPAVVAGALFAGMTLLYFWPVLVGGKVMGASSLLYLFSPWRPDAPPDLAQHMNPLLSDLPFAVFPWNELARQAVHDLSLPGWNPAVLAGTPFYANPQTGILSPFNAPLWALPLTYGIGVSAALKMWVGALGCWALARELRLGSASGLLAGVAFAFCAFNITWLVHETLTAVTAMLPWMAFFAERLAVRRRAADAIGLALVGAVAILGGHPGTALEAFAAVALYGAVRAATVQGADRRERLTGLGLVLLGLLLAGALTAVVALPAQLAGQDTAGAAARSGGGTSLPVELLRTVAFPDWWGRPSGVELTDRPVHNFVERTVYAGTVALLLAVVALAGRQGWRRKGPLAAIGALGLAVPFGLPVVRDVVVSLPLLDVVQNQRMFFLFCFAVAMLAAFGLDELLAAPRRQRRAWAAVGAGLALAAVAVVAVGPTFQELKTVQNHFRTGTDHAQDAVIKLTSVTWWGLFVLGVAAALRLLRSRRVPVHAVAALLVALALADGLRFATDWQPMTSEAVAYPGETPSIRFLQGREGRVVGLADTFPVDYNTRFGVRDVRGYDAPQPSERYMDLWRTANPAQSAIAPLSLPEPSPQALHVASVLGARWLAADPDFTPRVTGRGVHRAYVGADQHVYENRRAAPRALAPWRAEAVADADAALAAVADPAFDPRRDAVVEGLDAAPTAGAGARVSVVRDEDERVELRASLPRPGLVVLNDAMARGWSVRVDGRPAEALTANLVMRGVVVPAGDHTVEWRYEIPGLGAGAAVSSATLAGLVAWALTLRVRRRRARAAPPERS